MKPPVILDARDAPILGTARRKAHGIHYTPPELARFVARRAIGNCEQQELVALDPACGDGELLLAAAAEARLAGMPAPQLVGVDRDQMATAAASERLRGAAETSWEVHCCDFLDADVEETYDLVISNPPYVRTQLLGAARAQALGRRFGLSGRVDLYHAFVAAITDRLIEGGVLGLLCSNRFMTTKGGISLRSLLVRHYEILELWDLGDTRLFEAAVLPVVIVARRASEPAQRPGSFVRVYEERGVSEGESRRSDSVLDLLASSAEGAVEIDARRFRIERGELVVAPSERPWRLTSPRSSRWLQTVAKHTAGRFGDLGPIRVGIKTTADSVFIRPTWDDLPDHLRPEQALIHPLLTHRVAARWLASESASGARSVLYPHEYCDGQRRPVDLSRYPRAAAYLEQHRARLEGREYVLSAGRAWYEIWVPQQPDAWAAPKLVWPDISDRPRFFLDRSGFIVNGDCYWLSCGERSHDEIALALAVANSAFAVRYYDLCCGNRLYAGRRRFITQYLTELPMPEVSRTAMRDVAGMVRRLGRAHDPETVTALESSLDAAICELFGLKKVDW